MKTLLLVGIMLISMNSLAYENIHDVVKEGRECWFEDSKGFTCKFTIGDGLRFVMVDVGGPETMTLIEKSDAEDDKYYLKVSSSHNCLIVADQASKLFQGGFAYISSKNAKVYNNSDSCSSGLAR